MSTKTEKYCHKCGATKSVAQFTKNRARHDGLSSYCTECFKQYNVARAWSDPNRKRKRQPKRSFDKKVTHKFCPSCKLELPVEQFSKNQARSKWDGLDSHCKLCNKERQSKRYQEDPREEYFAELRKRPEFVRRRAERQREREREDVQFLLAKRLRTRLYIAIRNNQKVGSAIRDLGCSIDYLKVWLERRFQEGMTWDNYGEWHIDHIRPLTSFDLEDRSQFLVACNWVNLQPLWGSENISKGNK